LPVHYFYLFIKIHKQVEAKGNKDFATAAKLTGCATFPCKLND
jgi:hypothetical protein